MATALAAHHVLVGFPRALERARGVRAPMG